MNDETKLREMPRDAAAEGFPKYYTVLFNGVTDAIEALDAHNHIRARELLVTAQQEAEELYISGQ